MKLHTSSTRRLPATSEMWNMRGSRGCGAVGLVDAYSAAHNNDTVTGRDTVSDATSGSHNAPERGLTLAAQHLPEAVVLATLVVHRHSALVSQQHTARPRVVEPPESARDNHPLQPRDAAKAAKEPSRTLKMAAMEAATSFSASDEPEPRHSTAYSGAARMKQSPELSDAAIGCTARGKAQAQKRVVSVGAHTRQPLPETRAHHAAHAPSTARVFTGFVPFTWKKCMPPSLHSPPAPNAYTMRRFCTVPQRH